MSNTMEFTETNRADLSGDLESRVQGLLQQAFPDSASEHSDYYTLHGTPAVIVILREGREVVGHLAAYRREVEIGCEPLEIGMIGGVAIAPNHRGRGHSRALVQRAHAYLKKKSIPISIPFAHEPRGYASIGCKIMPNLTQIISTD